MTDLPIIDVGRGGGLASARMMEAELRNLRDAALRSIHVWGPILDEANNYTRDWLRRVGNPYRAEIDGIAQLIDPKGVYLLNLVYEWACSTCAGPSPDGQGNRLVRLLDWGLAGLGPYSIIARHDGDAGPFASVTWPGYCGVLTGMAPGRFSAAINKAPIENIVDWADADEVLSHLLMLFKGKSTPPEHLLRQVFETATDFAGARAMLEAPVKLTRPAIFTLSGATPGEGCVIEAKDAKRKTLAADAGTPIVAAANDWYISKWAGHPHAYAKAPNETAKENNVHRRAVVTTLQALADPRWENCQPPLVNKENVHFVVADARRRWLCAEAIDSQSGPQPKLVLGPTVLQM